MTHQKRPKMTTPEIEGLLLNADEGERFTGLSNTEAVAFRNLGFALGRLVLVTVQDAERGLYQAEVTL